MLLPQTGVVTVSGKSNFQPYWLLPEAQFVLPCQQTVLMATVRVPGIAALVDVAGTVAVWLNTELARRLLRLKVRYGGAVLSGSAAYFTGEAGMMVVVAVVVVPLFQLAISQSQMP